MLDKMHTTGRKSLIVLAIGLMLALAFALTGCGNTETVTDEPATTPAEEQTTEPKEEEKEEEAAAPVETQDLVLASTTSTQDSGLFDELIPAFEEAHPEYNVQVIAVGTGEALQKGRDGDADVLLVHAKASEEEFVAEGYGDYRKDVMYNDYVIVAPEADPAGIKDSATAADAFKKIADSGSEFISRGDDSGTHKKELAIWKEAGMENPEGDFYRSSGQGMGDTLKIADEEEAYTLADRATYLSMFKEGAIDLAIAFEGADDLLNQYGVLPVKEARVHDGAEAFADWITSADGQAVIKTYGTEKYGQPLFFPNAQ